jgi:hypothetical protein
MLDKQLIDKWCDALQSGVYKQYHHYGCIRRNNKNWRKTEIAYCPISLCCLIAGYDITIDLTLPEAVLFSQLLAVNEKQSFPEIAAWIRQHFPLG